MKEKRYPFITPLDALLSIYTEYRELENKYNLDAEKIKDILDSSGRVMEVKTNYKTLLFLRSFFNNVFGGNAEVYGIMGIKFYTESIDDLGNGELNATIVVEMPYNAWRTFELFMGTEIFHDIAEDDDIFTQRCKLEKNFTTLEEDIRTDDLTMIFTMIMSELLNNEILDKDDEDENVSEDNGELAFNSFDELMNYIMNKTKTTNIPDSSANKEENVNDESNDIVLFDSMDTHHTKKCNSINDKSKCKYASHNEVMEKVLGKKNEGKETLSSDHMGTANNNIIPTSAFRLTADEARRMSLNISGNKAGVLNFALNDIDNKIKSAINTGKSINRIDYDFEYLYSSNDESYHIYYELINAIICDLESRGFNVVSTSLFNITISWF